MCKSNLLAMALLVFAIVNTIDAKIGNAQTTAAGAYFGLTPPGETAEVFAPDFISRPNWWVQNCCFSPDGQEFIFTLTDANWSSSRVMYTRNTDGQWSEPAALFDGSVACFSHDGNTIYFIAYQRNGSPTADVWACTRTENGWSQAVKLAFPVNSEDGHEWEVTEANAGILYFSSNRPGGFGDMDVYRAVMVDGQFQSAENLGAPINTNSLDECPWVAPDESYMVFNSWKSNPKFAGNNLYITYKKADGSWTFPKDLGAAVNTNYLDIYPYISPDGKYFFWTLRKVAYGGTEPSRLYWMSTSFVERMRQENFTPYVKNAIEPVTITAGQPFSYQVPANVFCDDDDDPLTFTARKTNGELPDWLAFNPATVTFSGTAPSASSMWIRLTATDPENAGAFCSFRLVAQAGTGVDTTSSAPAESRLRQNYPNPFNPGTVIGYSLDKPAQVTLCIYNALGQIVKTLVNEIKSAGEFTAAWDATDDAGQAVAPGVYLYLLVAGSHREMKKMLLIK